MYKLTDTVPAVVQRVSFEDYTFRINTFQWLGDPENKYIKQTFYERGYIIMPSYQMQFGERTFDCALSKYASREEMFRALKLKEDSDWVVFVHEVKHTQTMLQLWSCSLSKSITEFMLPLWRTEKIRKICT